jgi:Uncharacterized conserved protein (DUF2278)
MLPAYGVVVGTYVSFGREQGKWMHVDANILAGQDTYQAAVDVNEPNGQFQYQILDNLDASLFVTISSLSDGFHQLASNATSGAIDYARSPILQEALAASPGWNNVTGDEAGNALVGLLEASTKMFAFGAPYATGLGVHDVHCNQGDPPTPAEFRALDGIWQDGCVFVIKADGTLSAYLGKFSTQTLDTNNQGIPISENA